jgi:hypothetical protein
MAKTLLAGSTQKSANIFSVFQENLQLDTILIVTKFTFLDIFKNFGFVLSFLNTP